MLFIVNCEVVKNYYMDDTIRNTVNHIVEAYDEESAKYKVTTHYESQNIDYYVTYHINFNYCNELIK